MEISNGGKVNSVLQNHLTVIQNFEKKVPKITSTEAQEFLNAIKNANAELKAVAPLKVSAGVKSNNLAALERLSKALASNKAILEQVGAQIPRSILQEIKVSKELLEEENKRNYETVGGIEPEGGLDTST